MACNLREMTNRRGVCIVHELCFRQVAGWNDQATPLPRGRHDGREDTVDGSDFTSER